MTDSNLNSKNSQSNIGTNKDARIIKGIKKHLQSWDQLFLPACFIALLLFLTFSSEFFLTWPNLRNVLLQTSILAIVATGMTFVIIGGGFDLSAGSVVALSGTAAALAILSLGVPVGILVGLLIGAAIGLFNGFLISKMNLSPFIVTLGTLVTARGFALAVSGGHTVSNLPRTFTIIGTGNFLGIPYPAIIFIAVFVIGHIVLKYTAFGVKIFAVGGNREAARLSGIKVNKIIMMTFVICSLCASFAGLVLAGRIRAGEPTVGVFLELYAIAAVVLGGTNLKGGQGSLAKTLLGVLFIGVLQNGLNLMNVAYYWQQVAVGVVFVSAATVGALRAAR
ncbi:MAG: ABC transporter permease [Bacillota bacterium]|nr:ABC transporter permease [Bacillota bacterium]